MPELTMDINICTPLYTHKFRVWSREMTSVDKDLHVGPSGGQGKSIQARGFDLMTKLWSLLPTNSTLALSICESV